MEQSVSDPEDGEILDENEVEMYSRSSTPASRRNSPSTKQRPHASKRGKPRRGRDSCGRHGHWTSESSFNNRSPLQSRRRDSRSHSSKMRRSPSYSNEVDRNPRDRGRISDSGGNSSRIGGRRRSRTSHSKKLTQRSRSGNHDGNYRQNSSTVHAHPGRSRNKSETLSHPAPAMIHRAPDQNKQGSSRGSEDSDYRPDAWTPLSPPAHTENRENCLTEQVLHVDMTGGTPLPLLSPSTGSNGFPGVEDISDKEESNSNESVEYIPIDRLSPQIITIDSTDTDTDDNMPSALADEKRVLDNVVDETHPDGHLKTELKNNLQVTDSKVNDSLDYLAVAHSELDEQCKNGPSVTVSNASHVKIKPPQNEESVKEYYNVEGSTDVKQTQSESERINSSEYDVAELERMADEAFGQICEGQLPDDEVDDGTKVESDIDDEELQVLEMRNNLLASMVAKIGSKEIEPEPISSTNPDRCLANMHLIDNQTIETQHQISPGTQISNNGADDMDELQLRQLLLSQMQHKTDKPKRTKSSGIRRKTVENYSSQIDTHASTSKSLPTGNSAKTQIPRTSKSSRRRVSNSSTVHANSGDSSKNNRSRIHRERSEDRDIHRRRSIDDRNRSRRGSSESRSRRSSLDTRSRRGSLEDRNSSSLVINRVVKINESSPLLLVPNPHAKIKHIPENDLRKRLNQIQNANRLQGDARNILSDDDGLKIVRTVSFQDKTCPVSTGSLSNTPTQNSLMSNANLQNFDGYAQPPITNTTLQQIVVNSALSPASPGHNFSVSNDFYCNELPLLSSEGNCFDPQSMLSPHPHMTCAASQSCHTVVVEPPLHSPPNQFLMSTCPMSPVITNAYPHQPIMSVPGFPGPVFNNASAFQSGPPFNHSPDYSETYGPQYTSEMSGSTTTSSTCPVPLVCAANDVDMRNWVSGNGNGSQHFGTPKTNNNLSMPTANSSFNYSSVEVLSPGWSNKIEQQMHETFPTSEKQTRKRIKPKSNIRKVSESVKAKMNNMSETKTVQNTAIAASGNTSSSTASSTPPQKPNQDVANNTTPVTVASILSSNGPGVASRSSPSESTSTPTALPGTGEVASIPTVPSLQTQPTTSIGRGSGNNSPVMQSTPSPAGSPAGLVSRRQESPGAISVPVPSVQLSPTSLKTTEKKIAAVGNVDQRLNSPVPRASIKRVIIPIREGDTTDEDESDVNSGNPSHAANSTNQVDSSFEGRVMKFLREKREEVERNKAKQSVNLSPSADIPPPNDKNINTTVTSKPTISPIQMDSESNVVQPKPTPRPMVTAPIVKPAPLKFANESTATIGSVNQQSSTVLVCSNLLNQANTNTPLPSQSNSKVVNVSSTISNVRSVQPDVPSIRNSLKRPKSSESGPPNKKVKENNVLTGSKNLEGVMGPAISAKLPVVPTSSKSIIEELTHKIMESRDQLALSAKERELLHSRQHCVKSLREMHASLQQHSRLMTIDTKIQSEIIQLEKKMTALKSRQKDVRSKATSLNKQIKEKSVQLLPHKGKCISLSRDVKELGEKFIGKNKYRVTDLFVDDLNTLVKDINTIHSRQSSSLQVERGVFFKQIIDQRSSFHVINNSPVPLQNVVQQARSSTNQNIGTAKVAKKAENGKGKGKPEDLSTKSVTNSDKSLKDSSCLFLTKHGKAKDVEENLKHVSQERLPLSSENDILTCRHVAIKTTNAIQELLSILPKAVEDEGGMLTIDPHIELCPMTLSNGVCKETDCQYQHI